MSFSATTDAPAPTVDRLPCRARGFSLVELLVASTIGLMAMAALASLFATFGRTVSQSQSLIDLNSRMRNAAWTLRQDLQGMTAPAKSWARAEANAGYFEIVEGGTTTTAALIGDIDDRLLLTTLSLGNPFAGRLDGNTNFESPFAEVVWFCEPSTQQFEGQTLYNLYRRQLLISATPGAGSFQNGPTATTTVSRDDSDLSFRTTATGQTANSLSDLTKSANRFWTVVGATKTLQGDRRGEDLILSNVIAFDIRAYPSSGTNYLDQPFNTNYSDGGTPTNTPFPLGIEIRIRCIEPSSRQIRQATVVHAFDAQ